MYKSSRSENQLQFDIDNVKLGQLPGLFETVQNEGGFFKLFSDNWADGYYCEYEWDKEPETVADTWYDFFLKQNEAWVNPAYANEPTNNEFYTKSICPIDDKRGITITLVYDQTNDNTIVGWFIDAD